MNSKSVIANATIAGSFAAALAMIAAPVSAGPKPPQPTMDKCYGIAMKGDNDCAAGAGGAGAGRAVVVALHGNAVAFVHSGLRRLRSGECRRGDHGEGGGEGAGDRGVGDDAL